MSYDQFTVAICRPAFNWKVTRSLVSYDLISSTLDTFHFIERSPDHWWVTTSIFICSYKPLPLKGHQIIGELRPSRCAKTCDTQLIERSPDHWWVTTVFNMRYIWYPNWKVTRSLVSYDPAAPAIPNSLRLKGHQIIGELRQIIAINHTVPYYWKVTRSLVSYDYVMTG